MKTSILGIFLALILCSTFGFAIIVQASSVKGWQIENNGGQYSESKGTIRLWGPGTGNEGIFLYKEYTPRKDFKISLQAKAAKYGGFAIEVRSVLPFAGTVQGANFEVNTGNFLLSRYSNGWIWNIFATAQLEVWYTLKLIVHADPFSITAQAYSETGTLLGTYTASDMTNLAFGDIKYVGFGIWAGGDWSVKGISISGVR